FAGSALALHKVESVRGKEATLEEILYLPSGKVLKRLSLGYSGLLANIYWTRAVQYFGGKFGKPSSRFDLLSPLLDITTDLDPNLIVAYETGSIFLSQRPPMGAGEPDKAVTLVEKGIRNNPEYWRLYFTLGFIHYMDRKDFRAAQQAFQTGSEVPGALPWMRVMAARMAEKGNTTAVALELWTAIYQTSKDPMVPATALKRLVSLQAAIALENLSRRVQAYRQNVGALPSTWGDLIRNGWLPGVPRDPTGSPYRLKPDGTVQVEDP